MNDSDTSDKSSVRTLSEAFLSQLISDLDDNSVRAIILHGSYARGDACPPYSDVDLIRITKETPEQTQQKKFLWRDGYLLNLSSRPLSIYKEWLKTPEEAIFRIQSIREARILLDKDGAFHTFQQEAGNWKWEPLQEAANVYASQLLLEQTEIILKILRAIQEPDVVVLIEMIMLDLLSDITEAVAVQQGILVKSGDSYLRQVQETVGLNSAWTHYYMGVVGESIEVPSLTIEKKGVAALRLYQETVQLLQPSLLPEHRKVIEQSMRVVEQVLSNKDAL